jgi:hypothetical protein
MLALKIDIVKYIRDDQPGFVEAKFKDAWDKEFVVHDKVPIFTSEYLDMHSHYPCPGFIACLKIKEFIDGKGRTIVAINTGEPWAVDTIDGICQFDVLSEQLTEI